MEEGPPSAAPCTCMNYRLENPKYQAKYWNTELSGLHDLSAHAAVYGYHGLLACDILSMSILQNFEEACWMLHNTTSDIRSQNY